MTFEERIEYVLSVRQRIASGEKVEDTRVRYNPRFDNYAIHCDLRKALLRAIERTGVTKTLVAKFLDIKPQYLNAYLTKRQNLPYDKVEELLWLLGFRASSDNE